MATTALISCGRCLQLPVRDVSGSVLSVTKLIFNEQSENAGLSVLDDAVDEAILDQIIDGAPDRDKRDAGRLRDRRQRDHAAQITLLKLCVLADQQHAPGASGYLRQQRPQPRERLCASRAQTRLQAQALLGKPSAFLVGMIDRLGDISRMVFREQGGVAEPFTHAGNVSKDQGFAQPHRFEGGPVHHTRLPGEGGDHIGSSNLSQERAVIEPSGKNGIRGRGSAHFRRHARRVTSKANLHRRQLARGIEHLRDRFVPIEAPGD